MSTRFAKRLKRGLLPLAYVALACKLLIPVGYMPAPFGAGGPVTLCPGEFPIGLLDAGAGHGAHTERVTPVDHDAQPGHGEPTGHEDASMWEHCSLGALAATAALASEYVIGLPAPGSDSITATAARMAPPARPIAFHARAPPRPLS